jgi:hypothetical protein
MIDVLPTMLEDEFKKWKIEVRIPLTATVDTSIDAINEEISNIEKTMLMAFANNKADPGILYGMIGKRFKTDTNLASGVPYNSNTDHIIRKLLKNAHGNFSVTYPISYKANIPQDIVNELAKSKDDTVRRNAYSQRNVSSQTINKAIMNDTDKDTLDAALRSGKASKKAIELRLQKCMSSSYGYTDACSSIICAAIKNSKKIASEILKKSEHFEEDSKRMVVKAVASCASLNIKIEDWKKLSTDPNESVRLQAAQNNRNPFIDPFQGDSDRIKEALLDSRDYFSPIYKEKVTVTGKMMKNGEPELQEYMGGMFKKFAVSDNSAVRYSLARKFRYGKPDYINEKDELSILKTLKADEDKDVRKAAKDALKRFGKEAGVDEEEEEEESVEFVSDEDRKAAEDEKEEERLRRAVIARIARKD